MKKMVIYVAATAASAAYISLSGRSSKYSKATGHNQRETYAKL